MKRNVGPRADCVRRGVLPGLEAIFVVEVVGRFPVVEYFIAVLNGAEDGSQDVEGEEDVEGEYGFDMELVSSCSGGTSGVCQGLRLGLLLTEPLLGALLEYGAILNPYCINVISIYCLRC